MRPSRIVLPVVVAIGLGTALPLHAAPASSSTFVAPYDAGVARLDASSCQAGATCAGTPSANRTTGAMKSVSTFKRTTAAGGTENAFAYGLFQQAYRVPSKASKVTATFTWTVSTAHAAATSTGGAIFGYSGLVSSSANCTGGCTVTDGVVTVVSAEKNSIVGNGTSSVSNKTYDVTVTVAGKLPSHLYLYSYAFTGAGGQPGELCPTADNCQVVTANHAGTASASMQALLNKITVIAT